MKENLTQIVFILDRSGSMRGLEADTIGGFNGLIQKQKMQQGEAILTTVLFDDKYEVLHDGENINNVGELSKREYFVRGSTAMLDAIGRTIDSVGNRLAAMEESQRPSKVLFVITTDGMENASKYYTHCQIKDMIEHQRGKYSWEFLFLGANIDVVSTAKSIGIEPRFAAKFVNDAGGVAVNFDTLDQAICCFRAEDAIPDEWKRKIDENFQNSTQKRDNRLKPLEKPSSDTIIPMPLPFPKITTRTSTKQKPNTRK